jgi:hypothetical protein
VRASRQVDFARTLPVFSVALPKLIAAGYRSAAGMQRDPTFASLWPRPDFQNLMRDLAFPADPFTQEPALGAGAPSSREPNAAPWP